MKKILILLCLFFTSIYSQEVDKNLFVKDYVLVGINSDQNKFFDLIEKVLNKQKAQEIKNKINNGIKKEMNLSLPEIKNKIKIKSDFIYIGVNTKNGNKIFFAFKSDDTNESIKNIINMIKMDPKKKSIKVENIDNYTVIKNKNNIESVLYSEKDTLVIAPNSAIINEFISNKEIPDEKIINISNNTVGFVYIKEIEEEKPIKIDQPLFIKLEYSNDIRIIFSSREKENIKPIPVEISSPIFYFILPLSEDIKKFLSSNYPNPTIKIEETIGDQVFIIVNDFDYQQLINNIYSKLDVVLGIQIKDKAKILDTINQNAQGMMQTLNKPYPAFLITLPFIALNISIPNDYLIVSTKNTEIKNYNTNNKFLFLDIQRLLNKIPQLKPEITKIGINTNLKTIEGYTEDKNEYQDVVVIIK